MTVSLSAQKNHPAATRLQWIELSYSDDLARCFPCVRSYRLACSKPVPRRASAPGRPALQSSPPPIGRPQLWSGNLRNASTHGPSGNLCDNTVTLLWFPSQSLMKTGRNQLPRKQVSHADGCAAPLGSSAHLFIPPVQGCVLRPSTRVAGGTKKEGAAFGYALVGVRPSTGSWGDVGMAGCSTNVRLRFVFQNKRATS